MRSAIVALCLVALAFANSVHKIGHHGENIAAACINPSTCSQDKMQGICRDVDGSAACFCRTGFVGVNCETPQTPSELCHKGETWNGVSCVSTNPRHIFSGMKGQTWNGTQWLSVSTNPRHIFSGMKGQTWNGTQWVAASDPRHVFSGMKGQTWNGTQWVSASPCMDQSVCSQDKMQGVCLNAKGSPVCLCNVGFVGANCDMPANTPIKLTNACHKGETWNGVSCVSTNPRHIFSGMKGQTWNGTQWVSASPCMDQSVCSQDKMQGVCLNAKGSPVCLCNVGFVGANCDMPANTPSKLTNACHKGETWNGVSCVSAMSACMDKAVCSQNKMQGVCQTVKGVPICMCNEGFVGVNCETPM